MLEPKNKHTATRTSHRVLEVLTVVDREVCDILTAAGSANVPVASMAVGANLKKGAVQKIRKGVFKKTSTRSHKIAPQHAKRPTARRASRDARHSDNHCQLVLRFLLEFARIEKRCTSAVSRLSTHTRTDTIVPLRASASLLDETSFFLRRPRRLADIGIGLSWTWTAARGEAILDPQPPE